MNKQLVDKQRTCSQTNSLLTSEQLVEELPLKNLLVLDTCIKRFQAQNSFDQTQQLRFKFKSS